MHYNTFIKIHTLLALASTSALPSMSALRKDAYTELLKAGLVSMNEHTERYEITEKGKAWAESVVDSLLEPINTNYTDAEQRLLDVAKALLETEPENFDMTRFAHPCGTPACALGHYAVRDDLQNVIKLSVCNKIKLVDPVRCDAPHSSAWAYSYLRDTHFKISEHTMDELFDANGCDNARTALEAAAYIIDFVDCEYGDRIR